MSSTAWRRQFPTAALLDVIDAVADRVAERTTAAVLAELNRPAVEKVGHSPAEAAQVLGVGEATIRRYITDGTIKVGRLGERVLIHRSELDRLMLGVEAS